MPTGVSLEPELHSEDHIQFIADHRPSLPSGEYTVQVTQTLTCHGGVVTSRKFTKSQDILVFGDRYELHPEAVHAVFPPPGSRGDYRGVLPHVIFNRNTLPWERSAWTDASKTDASKDAPPWLALLLFAPDDEVPTPMTVPLSEIGKTPVDKPPASWQGGAPESAQHPTDKVVVIDVKRKTLEPLLPKKAADLKYRTHARAVAPAPVDQEGQSEQKAHSELSVVLGNRLPEPNTRSVVHLVSLEARYEKDPDGFKWLTAKGDDDLVRLVSLKSWQFFCTDPTKTFKGLLEGLNRHSTVAARSELVHGLAEDGAIAAAILEALHQAREKSTSQQGLLQTLDDDPFQLHGLAAQELSDKLWNHPDTLKTLADLDAIPYFDYWALARMTHYVVQEPDVSPDFDLVHGVKEGSPLAVDILALVNDSSREQLEASEISRVADKICDSRDQHGPFSTLAEVDAVHGMGPKTFGGLVLAALHAGEPERSVDFHLPVHGLLNGDDTALEKTRSRLQSGLVPLPHGFRQGDRSVSWYHGPLVPMRPSLPDELPGRLPAEAADTLLLFDRETGMFDVSYAAAWELGRMAMLADTRVALSLFHWKRAHAHVAAAKRYAEDFGYHLPIAGRIPAPDAEGLPEEVEKWLDDAALLHHVPFTYLVPDERLLPAESLRVFTVDPLWLECFRDGGLSVGRVQAEDTTTGTSSNGVQETSPPTISGLLIRSEVVSGYPGLLIDAYDSIIPADASHPGSTLTCLRRECLSKNVLLCLFQGDLKTVDIHLKPETLHFGFDLPNTDSAEVEPKDLTKKVRVLDGKQITGEDLEHLPIDESRIVDFPALADQFADHLDMEVRPAVFALQMIASPDLVRFLLPTGGTP